MRQSNAQRPVATLTAHIRRKESHGLVIRAEWVAGGAKGQLTMRDDRSTHYPPDLCLLQIQS